LNSPRDLTGPETVRIATTAYAETEDHTGRFLSERCTFQPHHRVEQARLYHAYTAWSRHEGINPASSRAFAARIREAVGLASPKEMLLSNQRKYYPGIGLLAVAEEEAE
ncbi:primase-like DNA-binding domain-containing protein, partial [Streptomyces globisporus]